MKETSLYDDIKYYPSFVIFKEGKAIDYLDANNENDTNYYKSVKDIERFFIFEFPS